MNLTPKKEKSKKSLEEFWDEVIGIEPLKFLMDYGFPQYSDFQEALEKWADDTDLSIDQEGATREEVINKLLKYIKEYARGLNKDIREEPYID